MTGFISVGLRYSESIGIGGAMSVSDVASIVAAITAVLAAGGAYVQYVLKRSLLPSVEFDVDFVALHYQEPYVVGDVSLVVKNIGSSMLIITNVRFRARYHQTGDEAGPLPRDPTEPLLRHRIPTTDHTWAPIAAARTFVQPGVTQIYRKPVLLSSSVSVINILGSFDYQIQIGPVTRMLVWLVARPPEDIDWRRGINDHTVRRTFELESSGPALA
jgi:hypothetical protein